MPSLRRRARVDRLPGLFLAIRSRRDGLAERSRGGPYCRAKQAAQAAEVIVKTTGPSAKIATAMATMATAMATASAKPSMRDVLGLLIAFNSIARRHMHALHSGMDVKGIVTLMNDRRDKSCIQSRSCRGGDLAPCLHGRGSERPVRLC